VAGAQNSGGRSAVRFFGQVAGRFGRSLAKGGSTPTRLRAWMITTAVVAVLFGLLGAIGIGRRDASLGGAADAARQLIAVQNVQVSLVHADALASENYLRGGTEDAGKRSLYVQELQNVSNGLVLVGNRVLAHEADRLAEVSTQLGEYSGLIEQARANNRQGYPVGAAYLRAANASAVAMVVILRDVQTSLRHQVNDNLDRADKAGAWLHVIGWPLLLLLVVGGGWVAFRFRRLLNVPLAAAGGLMLLLLVVGGGIQSSSMSDAEAATAGSLQEADLASQARSAAFDAHTQESLALIYRGNGAANEAKWQQATADVALALDRLCGLGGDCGLTDRYDRYVTGYTEVRRLDNEAGDWNEAVTASLGSGSAVFEQFAADSKGAADQNTAAALADLGSSADGLPALRVVVFLAGLAVAALALAGYGQRLREYR
jgi:hypothetical protein